MHVWQHEKYDQISSVFFPSFSNFIHSFIRVFITSFVRSFIHSFLLLFMHSLNLIFIAELLRPGGSQGRSPIPYPRKFGYDVTVRTSFRPRGLWGGLEGSLELTRKAEERIAIFFIETISSVQSSQLLLLVSAWTYNGRRELRSCCKRLIFCWLCLL